MEAHKHDKGGRTTAPMVHTTAELLLMQSKGKFLTREEKERVKKEAIIRRNKK